MALFHVQQGTPLLLPSHRLRVRVLRSPGTPPIRLTVRAQGADFPPAHELAVDLWLVQDAVRAKMGRVTLRLEPVPSSDGDGTQGASHVFPETATADLQIELVDPRSPGDDHDYMRLPTVDLAGLSSVDVVAVTPIDTDEGTVQIESLSRARELALGPTAELARATARSTLGVDQVADRDSVQIVLAVDASASMASHFRAGAVDAVAQALSGIGFVVSPKHPPLTCLVADTVTWSRAVDDPLNLAQAPDSGATITAAAPWHESLAGIAARSVTFLVTDSPFAHVPAPAAGETRTTERRHLVLLMEQDAYRASGVRLDLPCTLWPSASSRTSVPLLRSTIRSLVAAFEPPPASHEESSE